MTNEDIKKDDLQNDEDIDMKDENLDVNDEVEVDASDDEKYQDLMDKFMRLQADFSNSVSYTHLTLPTKRIV